MTTTTKTNPTKGSKTTSGSKAGHADKSSTSGSEHRPGQDRTASGRDAK